MSSAQSHGVVSGRSISFCKAYGNSEPHTNVILELVPAQLSLTADENCSARAGRGREVKDRIEPSTLFYGW